MYAVDGNKQSHTNCCSQLAHISKKNSVERLKSQPNAQRIEFQSHLKHFRCLDQTWNSSEKNIAFQMPRDKVSHHIKKKPNIANSHKEFQLCEVQTQGQIKSDTLYMPSDQKHFDLVLGNIPQKIKCDPLILIVITIDVVARKSCLRKISKKRILIWVFSRDYQEYVAKKKYIILDY